MQGEKKFVIALASILKPIDDTRMFGKLGISLLKSFPNAEIHVIGAGEQPLRITGYQSPDGHSIEEHRLGEMQRIGIRRLLTPLRVLVRVLRITPKIFVITTHELLWIAVVAKLLTGCSVVYDVQENYYLNILYTDAFPKLLRPFVANDVRMKEGITSPFVNQFILAERGYADELPFLKKYTVLENKVRKPSMEIHRSTAKRTKLLFSGTLAPTTGVLTAIQIARELHVVDPDITLQIIGYAAQSAFFEKLKSEITGLPYVTVTGGDKLVAHENIIRAIPEADAGIIAYPPNPSTKSSVPTKLYEYLGYRLPIILSDDHFLKYCSTYNAAVVWRDGKNTYRELQTKAFFGVEPNGVYWEEDEAKLVEVFKILNE